MSDAAPDAPDVVVVLARELPAAGRGETEAFARLRVEVREEGRRVRWRDGGVLALGRALERWPVEPLPHALEALLARFQGRGTPRALVPAEVQSWLARHAPRSFRLLLDRTELFQRDACFALVREGESVRFAFRPRGPVRAEARPAPLFELAHALAHGRVPGLGAAPEAVRLVRAHLVAHHLTGRLLPEVEWLCATRSFRLRGATRALFLIEGDDGGRRCAHLSGDGLAEPLALDLAPPPDTPEPVLRACLEWLLAAERPRDGELFVDPSGELVREPV